MLWGVLAFCGATLCPVMVAAILSSQCGLPHMPLGFTPALTNYRPLCSSYQVLPAGYRQWLTWASTRESSQEVPKPTHLEVDFRPQQSATQLAPQAALPKGLYWGETTLWGKTLTQQLISQSA
ncbi:hypothetical protein mRhiFer1_008120 [Rhinolophus ferrumequinum]|uniref:Uncharacterized protein n=1 Tax=Rhinolophus ferrumequinum TaxID=59479 RepID=A0A7J7W7Z7_RHIFE|nr:hypothetical protein mRhiFer1_008120 [Rhinolophus ferrumequinum]